MQYISTVDFQVVSEGLYDCLSLGNNHPLLCTITYILVFPIVQKDAKKIDKFAPLTHKQDKIFDHKDRMKLFIGARFPVEQFFTDTVNLCCAVHLLIDCIVYNTKNI